MIEFFFFRGDGFNSRFNKKKCFLREKIKFILQIDFYFFPISVKQVYYIILQKINKSIVLQKNELSFL